ncbi:hypothetical protein Y032_0334g2828 [Ancylostoma ceylanicum]|uniref:Uncharacterized protein n=1 Tax=Ancylostoma ceylanicum TaxID=53326 RepID=A0A016RYN1_9BILA|nr:hypothetical protein Y032_0334g2828 [Ancylostoma ceylanicum]
MLTCIMLLYAERQGTTSFVVGVISSFLISLRWCEIVQTPSRKNGFRGHFGTFQVHCRNQRIEEENSAHSDSRLAEVAKDEHTRQQQQQQEQQQRRILNNERIASWNEKQPDLIQPHHQHPQASTTRGVSRDVQHITTTPHIAPRFAPREAPREQGPRYTDVERKLIGQLRDVIAHLDLADVKQQIRAKELEDAYTRFQENVREFEAEKEAEKERVQRVRRQLEREKKIATKDGAERDKAIAEQIEDLTKTITQKDRQLSTLRLRLRKTEEERDSKDKELEENTKKMERLEKTCKILQRQMAQLRGNFAKQTQEMAAEIQASRTRNLRRKGSIGLLPSLQNGVRKEASIPDFAHADYDQRGIIPEPSKCVSWADKMVPTSSQKPLAVPRKQLSEMELVEEGTAYFGPCRLFKNGLGDWTKVTTTACSCDFYEYSNSDVRWFSCDRSIEIYYYGIAGCTVISLANGRSIRYFNDGQIEIYRLSGEISRFDPMTSQRCETMLDADGSRYVEIFDCTGHCVRLAGGTRTSERFGERSSYRGHPSERYVYSHNNVEPEWVEPEFSVKGTITHFHALLTISQGKDTRSVWPSVAWCILPNAGRDSNLFSSAPKFVSVRRSTDEVAMLILKSEKLTIAQRLTWHIDLVGPIILSESDQSLVVRLGRSPEITARRCPDGSLKIKFANVMVCCLGLEDIGYVKHTTRLEDGTERKRMCVEWGHVARARQRQIESRKCQQLTAFNATM